MNVELSKYILAVITTDPRKVNGGGAPIFYTESKDEQEKIANFLSRITEGVVHDLDNGVYILVKH